MASLHLVDGTYELFRAFFALPREQAPAGREVGAVRGLIGTMLALLREPGVTHVGVATDHVIESFRNRLFARYKTGAGVPAALLSQFPLAEEALRALGVVVWPMIEYEADDALASAAARYAPLVDRVMILSPDKDLCQCVRGEHVVTHDRRHQRTYDAAAIEGKFGVPPEAIPDLLALVGDPADGIPGLKGWGMKAAATVLRSFGSIEQIPGCVADWGLRLRGAERLAVTLRDEYANAMLYKRLATLRTDVPISEPLEALEWRGVRRLAYTGLCARLGFGQLADRPTRWRDD